MSNVRRWRIVAITLPELLLLLLIAVAVAHIGYTLHVEGYLPQPFLWNTRDTFMDWFNTAYWANQGNAYSVWRTVYPPLSFAFLKLFSTESCYHDDPLYAARNCDIYGQTTIIVCYVVGAIVAFIALHRNDPRTGWIRALALAFSYPGLFVLERGNLIIPCYVFFVLAYGNLLRGNWARAVFIAITINFKPYMLVFAFAFGPLRRWRMLEISGLATIAVYLVTYGIVGAGSISEIIDNTFNWVDFTSGVSLGDIYHTTTLQTYIDVVGRGFHALYYIDSGGLERWLMIAHIYLMSVQSLAVIALIGAWLQPKALTVQRVAVILFLLALSRQSPGAYTEVFVLFLVFLEPWKRPWQIVAIVTAYLVAIPYDYVFAPVLNPWSDSWLTGRAIVGYFGVGYGLILRPAVLLLMLAALSIDSLILVIRAHRVQRPSFLLMPAQRGRAVA